MKLRCPCLSREKLLKDDSAAAASPLCLGLSGGELPNQLTGGIVRMFNGHGFLRLQLLFYLMHLCTHTAVPIKKTISAHNLPSTYTHLLFTSSLGTSLQAGAAPTIDH